MGLIDRFQRGWNTFMNRDPTYIYQNTGPGYAVRPDRPRLTRGNERSIVTSVYNRIAVDAANVDMMHAVVDENGRFVEAKKTGLNNCLTTEANIDQSSFAFKLDMYLSILDEGCIAVVPVDCDRDPEDTESYDIGTMRTAKITEWKPRHVKINAYDDRDGQKKDILVEKRSTAIIENPFYAVMNEPNSTLQRLIRKLNLLDVVDEQSGSGKLDVIIQLPYVIKTDARREQADKRRKDIEEQLKGPYGIAYIDGTEKVTQLNRPVENNLMKQIEYLTSMLYGQLGITQSILDGTANEETMLNYYDRTVEPLVAAVAGEMKRKFLSKTARSQLQSIVYFRNPFKLVPVKDLAEIADKFTRNEIMTANEIRQVIGMKPSKDPKADELRNSNIRNPEEGPDEQKPKEPQSNPKEEIQNGS